MLANHSIADLGFILLSAPDLAVERLNLERNKGRMTPFSAGYPLRPWSIYAVLLICFKGRYANRVGLAYIHEDAWNDENPTKRDIFLC